MAKFSDKQIKNCVILEAEALYSFSKDKNGDGAFAYKQIDIQLMDGEGNIYSVSLSTKDLTEANFLAEASIKNILAAVYTKLSKSIDKSTTTNRVERDMLLPVNAVVGRKVDDFQ